jgi:peptide chain release factor 1
MNDLIEKYKTEQIQIEEEIQLFQNDQRKLKILYKKLNKVNEKLTLLIEIQKLKEQIQELQQLLEDPEFSQEAKEEKIKLENLLKEKSDLFDSLILSENEEYYEKIILEIRAGTGGDEAGLFAMELLQMYMKFIDKKKWKSEILSISKSDLDGLKSCSIGISSKENTYEKFQFEGGVHRVQRVPLTEVNGRIHTSTVTVAILPEPEEIEVNINDKDLRIDVYRSSGAGGQHVNKTESAVRITHLPTGIVVQCQDERSQTENKFRCMQILRAKIFQFKFEEQRSKIDEERNKLIGTGERSEKSRTYNFPQNRITDHRYNITLYKLDYILQTGDLDDLINQLKIESAKSLKLET